MKQSTTQRLVAEKLPVFINNLIRAGAKPIDVWKSMLWEILHRLKSKKIERPEIVSIVNTVYTDPPDKDHKWH